MDNNQLQGPVLYRPTKNVPTSLYRSNIILGPAQDRSLQPKQKNTMQNITRDFIGKELYTLDSSLKVKKFEVDAIGTIERKESKTVYIYDTKGYSYDVEKVFPSRKELFDFIMG